MLLGFSTIWITLFQQAAEHV